MQRAGTTIRRPAGGPRTVVAQRPGNKVVVVHGGGRGYVQRPVRVGRRDYVQRTYYVNGRRYVRAYRPFSYRGGVLNFYAPMRYYPVGLYGWAIGPWGVPIGYTGPWAGTPWIGYYGPYFTPWGDYPAPSFWLTDYLIANTLQTAFQAREEARADNPADTAESVEAAAPMSDEVKGMIETEVKAELTEAQAEAGESREPRDVVPSSLTAVGTHLFVASNNLEAQDTNTGGTCVIGAGDAIQMNGGLRLDADDVSVLILASKGSDCPVNSKVLIPLPDLVEMHNNMRETIDEGLGVLRKGGNNLPPLPAEAAGELRTMAFAAAMQPDPDVDKVINEETSRADQIEQEVTADYRTAAPGAEQVPSVQPPQPTPVTSVDNREAGLLASIQTGQTESQVITILGQPLNKSFLGGLKKLYEYGSGKITFNDGEVSGVELSGAGPVPARTAEPGGAPPAPMAGGVTLGLTESEVIAILGEPRRRSFLGGLKKMYEYPNVKIIFTDGTVSDVR